MYTFCKCNRTFKEAGTGATTRRESGGLLAEFRFEMVVGAQIKQNKQTKDFLFIYLNETVIDLWAPEECFNCNTSHGHWVKLEVGFGVQST